MLGEFSDDPAFSADIQYDVEISGSAGEKSLRELVEHVDRIAEIPNSLRGHLGFTEEDHPRLNYVSKGRAMSDLLNVI